MADGHLVGQEAPDFTLRDHNGADVTLSALRGQRNVVLMFYPWAFTGTCTGELCELRDRMEEFENEDTVTLAVSCDSIFSLRVFAEREGYTFSMLSDFWPHGAVSRAYGVFLEDRGVPQRGTFIIDRAGVVRWSVVRSIGEARDADTYAAALAAL